MSRTRLRRALAPPPPSVEAAYSRACPPKTRAADRCRVRAIGERAFDNQRAPSENRDAPQASQRANRIPRHSKSSAAAMPSSAARETSEAVNANASLRNARARLRCPTPHRDETVGTASADRSASQTARSRSIATPATAPMVKANAPSSPRGLRRPLLVRLKLPPICLDDEPPKFARSGGCRGPGAAPSDESPCR